MPRLPRVDVRGQYYHVLNRASARLTLFEKKEEYGVFEATLVESKDKYDVDIVAYCCMPNHFHLVLSPNKDGELSKFMYWFTMTLTQRWHSIQGTTGSGHIFQGRYKSFMIQNDSHLLQVIRYVERNPLRAKLVRKLENWKYSSYWRRVKGSIKQKSIIAEPPTDFPKDYEHFISKCLTPTDIESVRHSVKRGVPYGSEVWRDKMVDRFKLQATVRSRGRPRKGS